MLYQVYYKINLFTFNNLLTDLYAVSKLLAHMVYDADAIRSTLMLRKSIIHH